MRFTKILLGILFLSSVSGALSAQKKLVIIGSSTSACMNVDPVTECYVGRLTTYYNQVAPADTTIDNHLARGGTNCFNGMPSWYVSPYGTGSIYTPQTDINITAALALKPDVILVNYPTNAYDVLAIGDVMFCLRTIKNEANRNGIPCYITTSQPRTSAPTFNNSAVKLKLATIKDSILAAFGSYAVDFWTGLITADTSILYDSGDQTHMNGTGHNILFQRVLAKNVFGPVNKPTASNAGSAVAITLPTSSVTLDGSASTGSIAQYYWYQAQGPVSAVIGNNFSAVTTATGLTTAGTYVFALQVKDNLGALAYSYKTVTVNPAGAVTIPACVTNSSPANASTLATQTTATLTWPASSTATSYDVYLQAGTGTPVTMVTNTAALSYSASGLSAGTTYSWYIAPKNASGTATGCVTSNKTTFTTAAAGSQPTAANAGSAVTITLPTSSVTLDGSASTGNIVQYYWYQAQGPVSSVIANNFSTITTATGLTTAGTYVFALQVKDNLGTLSYSYKTVTVSAAGTVTIPACVTNTSPANASTLTTQTTATLTWPAASTATSYDVYLAAGTGTPTALVANTASLTYSATGLTAGTTYSWYIAPRNASGAATACATANKTTFTTAAAGAQPTASNAGSNVTITLPTSSVTLDGSASTGNIVQYYWYQAQGPVSSAIAGNFSKATTATGLTAAGTYVFGLQVIDNAGVHAYAFKTVVVKAAGTRTADTTALQLATPPVSITSAETIVSAAIRPNPVPTGQFAKLQITSGRACAVMINTVNSNGVVLAIKKVNLVAGINNVMVNTYGLGRGFHVISISAGSKPFNLTLLVE